MSHFAANIAGLGVLTLVGLILVTAMLGRIGSWYTGNAKYLNEAEGLPVGSRASEIACFDGTQEMHISFPHPSGSTFVVFGAAKCRPCVELLSIAATHPATARLTRIYVGDGVPDMNDAAGTGWELYTFADEESCRRAWRAPVSPYYHLVDGRGYVVAKGIANRAEHLDDLLAIPPAGIYSRKYVLRKRVQR